jgi:transcriptional regulator with XRE-family HTH domain
MNKTYREIESLCERKGITVNKLCTEIGIRNSLLSDFKSGRTKKLSTQTLTKISTYFKIPIDELVCPGFADRHGPPPQQTPTITDDDLMFALFGDVKDELTKEDLDDVRAYAEFVMKRKLAAQQKEGD